MTEDTGRYARLVNHSKKDPNCATKDANWENSPRLTLFAKKDIEKGEELFFDYNVMDRKTVEAFPLSFVTNLVRSLAGET